MYGVELDSVHTHTSNTCKQIVRSPADFAVNKEYIYIYIYIYIIINYYIIFIFVVVIVIIMAINYDVFIINNTYRGYYGGGNNHCRYLYLSSVLFKFINMLFLIQFLLSYLLFFALTISFAVTCGNNVADFSCNVWSGAGFCTHTHVQYMQANCKESCGLCGK